MRVSKQKPIRPIDSRGKGQKASFLFRFSLIANLALHYALQKKSLAECKQLFKAKILDRQLNSLQQKGMAAENLEPHLRQNPNVEQGLKELVDNALENLLGVKIIGRFGEGRLQTLQQISGQEGACLEVTSKTDRDIPRVVRFKGIKGERAEFATELEELPRAKFDPGTSISLSQSLSVAEQRSLSAYLEQKFKYVRGVQIFVNGRQINRSAEYHSLNQGTSPPQASRIEVTITDRGYVVRDWGKGMDAEALVKRYLAIGNSEGQHNHTYNDDLQPANLYFSNHVRPSKRGRVSILMCGVEIQGIDVEGIGLEQEVGLEMGTGLRLSEAKDKVIFGSVECQRLQALAEKLLTCSGTKKWAILNSLMLAIDQIEFSNGQKGALLESLYRTVSPEARSSKQVVFVPNRDGFPQLKLRAKKVYLDDRLFLFDAQAARLQAHPNYRSTADYQVYIADFSNPQVVYELTGRVVIINSCHADNTLMLNLLFDPFNSHGSNPDRAEDISGQERLHLNLPWEEVREAEEVSEIKGVKSWQQLRPADKVAIRDYVVMLAQTGVEQGAAVARVNQLLARRKLFKERFKITLSLRELLFVNRPMIAASRVSVYEVDGDSLVVESLSPDKTKRCLDRIDGPKTTRLYNEAYDSNGFSVSRGPIEGGGNKYFKKNSGDGIEILRLCSDGEVRSLGLTCSGFPRIVRTRWGDYFEITKPNGNTGILGKIEQDRAVEIASGYSCSGHFGFEETANRLYIESDSGDGRSFKLEVVRGTKATLIHQEDLGNTNIHGTRQGDLLTAQVSGSGGTIFLLKGKQLIELGYYDFRTQPQILDADNGVLIVRSEEGRCVVARLNGTKLEQLSSSDQYKPEQLVQTDDGVLLVTSKRSMHHVRVLRGDSLKELGGKNYYYTRGVLTGPKVFSTKIGTFIVGIRDGGYVVDIIRGGRVVNIKRGIPHRPNIIETEQGVLLSFEQNGQEKLMCLQSNGAREIKFSHGIPDSFEIDESASGTFLRCTWKYGGQDSLLYQLIADGDHIVALPILLSNDGVLERVFPLSVSRAHVKPLRKKLPAAKTWFKDKQTAATYKQRRRTMCVRLVQGDYPRGVDLELVQYLGRTELKALGSQTVKTVEARMANKDFEFQEIYMGFVEKLSQACQDRAARPLLRQAVSRWDQLVEVYSEDVQELQRLVAYFTQEELPRLLFSDKGGPQQGELNDWLYYFREKDLEGKIESASKPKKAKAKTGKVLSSIREKHNLAFYAWAGRLHKGWGEQGVERHRDLLQRYSKLPDKLPIEKKVMGDVVGQELREYSFSREFTQNSRDAGSKKLTVSSEVRERKESIEQVITFRDHGRGMVDGQVKELLLNVGRSGGPLDARVAGKRKTGKNGIGFESVFTDVDSLSLRTSDGRGKIVELKVSCVREENRLIAVNVDRYRVVKGNYNGTQIRVTKQLGPADSQRVKLKAILKELMFRRRLKENVGLVRDMTITHNGERVNQKVLSQERLTLEGRGSYALLETPEASDRVVQDGLLVNFNARAYHESLPPILQDHVKGCVFEVGEGEELTRGRGGLMVPEQERFNFQMALAMQRAVRNHHAGKVIIDGLPRDYLYGQRREFGDGDLEGAIPAFVTKDARLINNGGLLSVNFARYLGRGQNQLIKLLTLIEIESEDGKTFTLQDKREERIAKLKEPCPCGPSEEVTFTFLNGSIPMEKPNKQARHVAREVSLEPKHLLFRNLARHALGSIDGNKWRITFHSNPEASYLAGQMPGWIDFRVEAIDTQLNQLELGQETISKGEGDPNSYVWHWSFLRDLVHESIHARNFGHEDWSHGADHRIKGGFVDDWEQTCLAMIRAGYNPFRNQS